MNKTKPQRTDPKLIKQFFADAQKRAVAARKNLAIEPETAYQIAYEAMIKASLALTLSHGQRPPKQLGHHLALLNSHSGICLVPLLGLLHCSTACDENATTLFTT